jgi:type IV pilus assembly protein PilM
MSIFLPTQNSFGLDISDYVLRLVSVEKNKIVSAGEIIVPPGLIGNGVIQKPDKVADLIKKLVSEVKGKKIKTRYVTACLPEQKTFIKMIELPAHNEDEFEKILAEEIVKHIPYSVDEIYIDWQKELNQNSNKILIGVAPKEVVNSYQNVLQLADLIPLNLEIEAASITRCLIKRSEKSDYANITMDIGLNRTSLIVYDNQTVQFSISLPLSGDSITKTIAKTLNLTYEEAEKAKIICGFDDKKCDRALVRLLSPVIENLIDRINDAINFYQNHFTNRHEIKKIILCGGGANFKNLDKILTTETKLAVEKANLLTNLAQAPDPAIVPKNKYLSFISAVGLAMRKD